MQINAGCARRSKPRLKPPLQLRIFSRYAAPLLTAAVETAPEGSTRQSRLLPNADLRRCGFSRLQAENKWDADKRWLRTQIKNRTIGRNDKYDIDTCKLTADGSAAGDGECLNRPAPAQTACLFQGVWGVKRP